MSLIKGLVEGGKSALKTKLLVSPSNLAEQYFYWEGEGEGFITKIKVPLPNSIVVDAYSAFFYSALINLLANELIEDEDDSILELKEIKFNAELKGLYLKAKEGVLDAASLRKCGIEYIEYSFYILCNQKDEELIELIQEAKAKNNLELIREKIDYNKVHGFILTMLSEQGFDYPNSIEDLIPMGADLFYYVNSLKRAKTKKIDEEGVRERLVGTHRWL